MKRFILFVYRMIFLHKSLSILNYGIYFTVLRGIGILNYENKKLSGEEYFLRRVARWNSGAVIFDVGANEGEYSLLCKKFIPQSTVYSFEPHPRTYARLSEKAASHKFNPINAALDETSGKATLFDYSGESGTSHASLFKNVITEIHSSATDSVETVTWSLDDFINMNGISKINLLKIDTEGNEYRVLKGASQALKENRVDIIQFEFSELNIVSRTFMKDFYELLDGYSFYRLFPNGLVPLGKYNAAKCEIFLFQNIVAINNNVVL